MPTMKTVTSFSQMLEQVEPTSANYQLFLERSLQGLLTRDENPQSHICVYFLPYDRETKHVFIVHHKKSGLWISPGGHVDKNETLLEALNREIHEELGIQNFFVHAPLPFLLTTTPIENNVQPCKMHYDIWHLLPTDGKNFSVDPSEFHATRWMSISDAEKIVTDPPNLLALNTLKMNGDTYAEHFLSRCRRS